MITARANIRMRCSPMHSGLRRAPYRRPPSSFQFSLRGCETSGSGRASTTMTIEAGNIFAFSQGTRSAGGGTARGAAPHLRLERIVSHAQASPEGFWYDQEWAEWVIVLKGSAGLHFEGESAPRVLSAGDYLDIPAHTRHRVAWTDATEPTVWLALHHQ